MNLYRVYCVTNSGVELEILTEAATAEEASEAIFQLADGLGTLTGRVDLVRGNYV